MEDQALQGRRVIVTAERRRRNFVARLGAAEAVITPASRELLQHLLAVQARPATGGWSVIQNLAAGSCPDVQRSIMEQMFLSLTFGSRRNT